MAGHFVASFVYILPLMLFALLGDCVCAEFDSLYKHLQRHITSDGEIIHRSVEWYRQAHEKLCVLIEMIDEIFAPVVLVGIFASVLEMFMLVFTVSDFLTHGRFTALIAFNEFFWFSFHFGQVCISTVIGIKVNRAAHSILQLLYKLNIPRLKQSGEIPSLSVFLNKLTGNHIGFTCGGLFTIDASAVLTISGTYITYQLLLFQLQKDFGSPTDTTAAVSVFDQIHNVTK
ncbi:uncharacterized protein LOC129583397 [Paramacrobiotus metropolitanus]|uniref:uncharacterized protein LOC129583397 n=1 Tax=Paramacrobiotus metropolitanus TaxID=2943436 RepID=UPI002445CFB3|nr:uncharacterized protein LOC129583397 [Paramacrobiotus metropolitanus]